MLPITDPTWTFFIVLGVILFAPMLMRKLHIPSIVGLIIAGVLIGKHGFNLLERDDSFELFGKVGVYYIMFLASLEMNMQDMKAIRWKAAFLGLFSFLFPALLGFAANRFLLHYGLMASTLMAAMYASHTLISYPIVLRYGLGRRRSVSIATGGTIVADVLTLLVLAGVVGMLDADASRYHLPLLSLKVVAAGLVILLAFPRIGHWFFRRYNDVAVQYIFVLSLVFLGAGLMELIGIEGILGAFLTGIALNRLIPPSSPLMSHVEFIGNSIFIPYFLIGVGMLINISAFLDYRHTLPLAAMMLLVACLGKWLAAWLTQRVFRLTRVDRNLIFGLTNSRAAATLAVVLVGYELRVVDDIVLNATMLLILFSCIVSSFATERASRTIALSGDEEPAEKESTADHILVGLSVQETVEPLVNLALMVRSHHSATALSAVSVVLESNTATQAQGAKLLENAKRIAAATGVNMNTYNRWAVNITTGVYHTMMETGASELLISLHQKRHLSDTFYGRFTSTLLAVVQNQILIYRPVSALNTVTRIHLLMPKRAEHERGFRHWAKRIAELATQLSCRIEVYGTPVSIDALRRTWESMGKSSGVDWHDFNSWSDLSAIVHRTRQDHMMIAVVARRNSISYHKYMERLPNQLERYFSTRNLLIVFPDQYVESDSAAGLRSGVPVKVR